jgi:hypothetical protein
MVKATDEKRICDEVMSNLPIVSAHTRNAPYIGSKCELNALVQKKEEKTAVVLQGTVYTTVQWHG